MGITGESRENKNPPAARRRIFGYLFLGGTFERLKFLVAESNVSHAIIIATAATPDNAQIVDT